MTPTFIGFAMMLIGVVLMVYGRIEAMAAFCLFATLMGGGSAITMGALGGASLLPSQFGLIFLMLRIALPSARQMPLVREGTVANSMLVVYVGYAIVSAFVLSKIFTNAMQVVPLKPSEDMRSGLFSTVPLQFTTQNITASFNMTFTLLSAIAMYVAAKQPRGAVMLAKTGTMICFVHSYLGISAALLASTPYAAFLKLFRNGSYYQHNQSVEGFIRITGIHPEPSGYAQYGFIWFVFATECWLRGILPKRSGPAALIMGSILFISTSSTAYVSLGAYAAVLLIRMAFTPQLMGLRKILVFAGLFILGCVAISAMLLIFHSLSAKLLEILEAMTINKQQSSSGLQRAFWAKQGIDAFKVSHGLGIGAGSFRSSSIFTAILGSVGVIGSLAFVLFTAHVFKPFRTATYLLEDDKVSQVGVAAAWTVVMMLVPAGIGSPSPDPGFTFGAFSGAALALRGRSRLTPNMPWMRRRRPDFDTATPNLQH